MPRVFVLDTGGTFSMEDTSKGLDVAPPEKVLAKLKALSSKFKHIDAEDTSVPSETEQSTHTWRYNPLPAEERQDSSEATPEHWQAIAEVIQENFKNYDAFVVIHGTDTLVYLSAALAFMLPKCTKPVIVTGAQAPVLSDHTDAANNFLGSLEFAVWRHSVNSDESLAGVYAYFNNKLLRGATVVKLDSQRWDAFDSPRFPPVGELKEGRPLVDEKQTGAIGKVPGTGFQPVLEQYIFNVPKPATASNGRPYPLVIHLFPGIDLRDYSIDKHYHNAVILAAYGCGNGPKSQQKILEGYLDNFGLLAVVTECLSGRTSATYAACIEKWDVNKERKESRIAVCENMTLSCAFAKATVFLGNRKHRERSSERQPIFRRFMRMSMTGELDHETVEAYFEAGKAC